MPIYRLEVKNYNKGGTTPVGAHVHYLLGPQQAPIQEHAAHALRVRMAELPRDDLVASGHQHMPAWAQEQPLAYWEAAQWYTRSNGVLAKEVLVTLPKELDHAANRALIAQFLATMPPYPTTWAFHEPRTRNGRSPQPHCHILVSPRGPDDTQERVPAQHFRQPNHGGISAQRLWTKREEIFALRTQWETLLMQTLRHHGLQLDKAPTIRELRLSWKEMKEVERFMKRTMPEAWGQEHRIPGAQITAWQTQEKITLRQATWMAQRGQKQLTSQIEQARPQVWHATRQLERARPWQVVTKYRANKTQRQAEATIQTLLKQRMHTVQVYTQWLSPAMAKAKAQWQQEKAAERAQRRGRHHGARLLLSAHTPGRGLQVQIEGLDEQQRQRQLAMQRERERDGRGW